MAYDNLTTVASLKMWLKASGGSDDAEIGFLIETASELIGRFCNRDNLGSVIQYTENYFRGGGRGRGSDFDLTLRHFPIVSVASVKMNNVAINVLTQNQLQSSQSGVFVLEEDGEPRILKFRSVLMTPPVSVVYMAGYAANAIPMPLQQACIQFASEIYRSPEWIGVKSRAIAGETITYDTEGTWGMSKRVQTMLQNYRDIVPFRGY